MELLAILQLLNEQIAAIQAKLVDAQAALEVEKQASYNLGFSDGGAAKQSEIDSLLAQIEELKKNPVDQSEFKFTQADMDQAVAAAIVQLKVDLLAKYKEAQAQEGAIEKSIEDLLA